MNVWKWDMPVKQNNEAIIIQILLRPVFELMCISLSYRKGQVRKELITHSYGTSVKGEYILPFSVNYWSLSHITRCWQVSFATAIIWVWIAGSCSKNISLIFAYIRINGAYKYKCSILQEILSPAWLNVVSDPR